jgi:hypothetical protein
MYKRSLGKQTALDELFLLDIDRAVSTEPAISVIGVAECGAVIA